MIGKETSDTNHRQVVARQRALEVAEGKLVLLGIELTGILTIDDIYKLEASGLYIEPAAFGVAIYGPNTHVETAIENEPIQPGTTGSIALAGTSPSARVEYGVIANSSDRISRSTGSRRRGGYGFARHPGSYPTRETE